MTVTRVTKVTIGLLVLGGCGSPAPEESRFEVPIAVVDAGTDAVPGNSPEPVGTATEASTPIPPDPPEASTPIEAAPVDTINSSGCFDAMDTYASTMAALGCPDYGGQILGEGLQAYFCPAGSQPDMGSLWICINPPKLIYLTPQGEWTYGWCCNHYGPDAG